MVRKLKKISVDSSPENEILIGMIVSDGFLREIASIGDISLFQNNHSKIVANWCLEYYESYGKSPKNIIQDIYQSRKDKLEEGQLGIIEKLLNKLSSDWDSSSKYNLDYWLDKAEKYFSKRSLEKLASDIRSFLSSGDLERAQLLPKEYKLVSRERSLGVDILRDMEAVKRSYFQQLVPLFSLPGELGNMIGPLCRDDFLAVFGPGKRGKSYWIQEIGFRAALKGYKVLFISLEMPLGRVVERIYQNLLAETTKKEEVSIPYLDCGDKSNCDLKYEIKGKRTCLVCKGTKKFIPEIKFKKEKKEGLSWDRMRDKARFVSKLMKSGVFRVQFFPAKSKTVKDIEIMIKNLKAYDSWVPDVIVVDYADLILPSNSRLSTRDQINDVWEGLRRLGQSTHSLMISASHTNKATFKKRIQQTDASEDVRKLNHITHAIALNQLEEEKEKGRMRVSLLAKRFDYFNTLQEVIVLQCLKIGKVYIDSFVEKRNNERE